MVVHSAQVYIQFKPLFSRHKGIGVQFTDEPTGNLDKRNAIAIAELLGEAAHKYEKCVIVVTHSEEIAKYGDVILEMTDGKLEIRRD